MIKEKMFSKIGRALGLLFLAPCSLFLVPASAMEFKYSGYGTVGTLTPDLTRPQFIGDWRIRAQADHTFDNGIKLGAAYALDDLAIYQRKYSREAMIFLENHLGRIEAGLTDSIAYKLGSGLPDVGGLRVNDNSILFREMPSANAIISNPLLSGGRYAPRLNIVTTPTRPWQFGVSATGLTGKYKYGADAAIKYRDSEGKVKTSLSFGASFIDSPENFQTDAFSAPITADSRAQAFAGINLQYNSWIWGMTLRAIYDTNAVGPKTDGAIAGTGLSYDILSYSISGTYLMSAVGVWDNAAHYDHTGILSLRYKYNEKFDLWMSGGGRMGGGEKSFESFAAAGLRLTF
jgi:hypothetical protein